MLQAPPEGDLKGLQVDFASKNVMKNKNWKCYKGVKHGAEPSDPSGHHNNEGREEDQRQLRARRNVEREKQGRVEDRE